MSQVEHRIFEMKGVLIYFNFNIDMHLVNLGKIIKPAAVLMGLYQGFKHT